ncbi:hypothetical protein ZIOFF_057503 [Zingiber officinale]|uniref:glutamate carboxypeptidase II n=1 Tax=Zingiber officinale TaxID=94328 RepID=A0A8J5KAB0_ZINOF|nr:hypothetical protein ZIOFF_057503 [Zingiber officinale]
MLIFKVADLGGVERGTVLLGGVGDLLTPGWATASDEGGERLSTEEADVRRRFPKIPSMPVAEVVALEILSTLGGPTMPLEWKDDLRLAAESGVGPGRTLVSFTYQEDRKLAKIKNIFDVILGREEADRYVILGNHRDAWTFGAVDPNSGTATLLDVARRYGSLLRSGWRPRRTIIICSWDAEEFGMIGSTEWVEQNLGWLTAKAVAYLNVDCAVQGDGFFAGASPQLDDLLVQVMKQIQDPDIKGTAVYDTWVAKSGGVNKIERLGRADSDFSAFLHIAGVPSTDMFYGDVFTGYHTALDNYKWMSEHGDPSFHHHVAIAEIWGLLGLRLADDPVLPFDYLSYATQLLEHATALNTLLDEGLSLRPLHTSIDELTTAIREVLEGGQKFQELDDQYSVSLRRHAFNDGLILAERGFLEAECLQGRPWFKHLLYSPPKNSESKFSFFPGIANAISQAAHSTGKEVHFSIVRFRELLELFKGQLLLTERGKLI